MPRHPETNDDVGQVTADEPASKRGWLTYVVAVAAMLLLVLAVLLHVTGTLGGRAH